MLKRYPTHYRPGDRGNHSVVQLYREWDNVERYRKLGTKGGDTADGGRNNLAQELLARGIPTLNPSSLTRTPLFLKRTVSNERQRTNSVQDSLIA